MNPNEKIDYDTVVAEVSEIVKKNSSSHESRGCVYFDNNGSPSCLIGHWLRLHGIKPVDVKDYNTTTFPTTYHNTSIHKVLPMNEMTLTFLEIVQDYQDGGYPWRLSLFRTLEYMGRTWADEAS